ncbi:HAMP domain-containing histidine kinase [Caulobacter sp. 602-2]|uniref:histidine kinase n=1 Tax=Caulobacter sp. 602-2 TaxID=2710887 RepID=A0A6G4QV44_9CAUL|nr:HAMP domain-containing sensor histidine kinase [Caulobacter sp. 602-2]NGM49402.1 HAMP domain-containing histidine kinase [Caulobacter sp. 602-2]
MRLPRLVRSTPFRLTLLFLALFAAAATAFLGYIYIATAGEVDRRADAEITREMESLEAAYRQGGINALNQTLVERSIGERPFVYFLADKTGKKITGSIEASPLDDFNGVGPSWDTFTLTETDLDGAPVRRPARGVQERLAGGEILFVGADVAESQGYVMKIVRALWGAGALVIILGLAGGVLISRNVSRSMQGLVDVVNAVRGGDLHARAKIRGVRDEYDELAEGLNDMLDRIERLMGGLRHAGDAIAHDLRSPLTRLRARMEVALIDAENGKGDPVAALETALADADGVLKTFNAVLAIARLQAAGQAPDQKPFDASDLTTDMAELYEFSCEDKGLDFKAEVTPALSLRGNREFIAQALANLLDNAIKYTPEGGAIMLRLRRRSSGELEFSVTDTGPGVPEEDRARVVQRFVRLENSRSEPGAGLGLSLVQAVAASHGGRLELAEGPGEYNGMGPGLRVALVLPRVE